MKNLQAWSMKNTVEFYVQERSRAKDLYESEAAMLLPVLPHVGSMLDVGCAVGNFCSIVEELNPKVSYVGLDTSEGMIREAQRRHPKAEFCLGNGRGLPFEDASFDLAFCTGVLHHNPDYMEMVAEMFRVSRRFVVIDLPRLVTQPYSFDLPHSYMVLKERFPTGSEEIIAEDTRVPYVLADVTEMLQGLLGRFAGRLAGIAGCGYYGTPHQSVSLPITPVIFTVVLLVKGEGPPRYHFQLPDDAQSVAEAALGSVRGIKADSVETVFADHRP
jgi:SAM-dependent methyltransferase